MAASTSRDWQTATSYLADDAVVHQGQAYRATTNFTSAATLLADLTRWQLGALFRWFILIEVPTRLSTDYYKGDLVQTGAGANTNHYISPPITRRMQRLILRPAPENTNWTLLISGTYTTTNADRQYAFFMGLST